MEPRYKRILLKLSGDALRGEQESGIDPVEVQSICTQVRDVIEQGVQPALVIGGGNILRGAEAEKLGMNRATADIMGMLATMINALAIQDGLESMGLETRMLSALKAEEVCEPYIRRRAIRHLEQGRVVILAGGTGNPYFTTDTTAAVRSMEISADVLMKATKVDGVYNADPVKDPSATRYDRLTYMDVIQGGLRVMDQTAITHCMEHNLPILVFNLKTPGNIVKAVCGEPIGTWIGSSDRGTR